MPSGEACFRDLCSKYKQGAKKRGLTFVLAKEEVRELFAGNCFYCGRAPFKEWKTKGCRGSLIFNGIDRVDSGLGYTPENSVSCCTPCNYAKREMGTEEFLAHIERISQHQTPEYGLCGC